MTSTHKHHLISIQYPSHKCLPEKSCLDCLRILIMSWLFKDPIVTVAWLNFNNDQSNSKKWPKVKKIKLPKMKFFLRKQNSFNVPITSLFILENFKKILGADPELWGCAIFGPKMAHLSWTIFFFCTNHYYYFHLIIGPFHCAKF